MNPKENTMITQDEITVETVTIRQDGKSIYGKLYRPADNEKHPAILFCHGFNGSCDDFIDECQTFAQNGYAAIAFDFCGGSLQSRSSGKSTDMTIFTEKQDLLNVFDYIKHMDCVDKENIYLFGASQGGCVSALAAEELQSQVKAMVLYYPALCIADDWRKNYPSKEDIPETTELWGFTLGAAYFLAVRDFDILESIGTYEGSVLIIHGSLDDVVPLSYSKQAESKYNHAKLVVQEGEGHGFSPAGAKLARDLAVDFILHPQS